MQNTSYSLKGLLATFRYEEAFRIETLAAIFLLPLGLYLGNTSTEKVLLAGSVLVVLIVEILNSAIENVVDRFGTERHSLAGRAKDQGSAAVLLSLLLLLLVWGLLLFF